MDAHEQEQIESIKSWWRENRWYIVGGLVVSAVLVGGWRYWQELEREQAEAASLKYEAAVTQASLQDVADLAARVAELQDDYGDTPYASLGTLELAAAQVGAGDYAAAAESLRWVMDNTADPELALVARLRLARVLLQQGAFADVHKALDVAGAGRFAALYEELRGDAFLGAGDRENARAAYETALAQMEESGLGDRGLVQMKLENLAMPLAGMAGKAESDPGDAATGDAGTTDDEQ